MVTKMKKITRRTGALLLSLLIALGAAQSASAASTWLGSVPSDVPTRIALDSQGNIYVTEARDRNLLRVLDRKGKLLRTLPGLSGPAGVAVDGQGRVYIASFTKRSVDVYTGGLVYSHSLGAGKGEFNAPHSIAVSAAGLIYVSDSKENKVKVYNANGTFAFAFGGWGKGNGQFNSPLGMAINEAAGELYVLDWQVITTADGETAGARVQVFDLQGNHRRSFGEYGTGEGKMIRPLDLALDRDGRVYIADGYQGVIHVFTSAGVPAETIFDRDHPTKTPIGLAVGKDNRVFIATNDQKNVDIFGMTGYTTLEVAPAQLSFSAARGTLPPAQTITVTNSGNGALEWTAAADRTWITLARTDPATLTVTLAGKDLAVGTYTGAVTITTTTGAAETIAVTLTVTEPPAVLNVTPQAGLAFKAQQNGPVPPAQTIDIRNLGGGTLGWTAVTTAGWLTVSATAGAAPSQILVQAKTALPVGTHTGTVTITAAGAQGSPAQLAVTVTVTDTGTLTITTNLAQASYTITGPAPMASATATGTLWKNDEAAPGDYRITFEHVTGGYKRPQSRTVTVMTGKETQVAAEYAKKPAATHIVAVTETAGPPKDKTVTVLTAAGDPVGSFKPFSRYEAGLTAAVGDLDGSGTDRIVVTDGAQTVKVYSTSGAELAALNLPKWQKGAVLALGDIDNDGKADILVGSEVKRLNRTTLRQVQRYSLSAGKLEDKGTILSEEAAGGYGMAVGDLNGDLANELVLADTGGVRAYQLTNGQLAPTWNMQGSFEAAPQVAAGDVDDDGAAEIALSIPGVIQVLRGTGEPTGIQIGTVKTKTGPESACVAMGDVDGNGTDELAAGTPAASVQLYKGDGTASGSPIAVPGGAGPAGVSLGRL